jgi:opacity protein-like surface antigen
VDFAWAVHAGLAYNVTSEAEAKKAYIHGWSLGGGLEVMVMPKAFLRAEYEYIAFAHRFGRSRPDADRARGPGLQVLTGDIERRAASHAIPCSRPALLA